MADEEGIFGTNETRPAWAPDEYDFYSSNYAPEYYGGGEKADYNKWADSVRPTDQAMSSGVPARGMGMSMSGPPPAGGGVKYPHGGFANFDPTDSTASDRSYAETQKYLDRKWAYQEKQDVADLARRTTAAANDEWTRRWQIMNSRPNIGEMPDAPIPDRFQAPGRSDARIAELTAQKSAVGLRDLRDQVQKVRGRNYENPNVGRMTLRDALSGYGKGLGSVMSEAQSSAERQYNTEYASKYGEAEMNWRAANAAKMRDWESKITDYLQKSRPRG